VQDQQPGKPTQSVLERAIRAAKAEGLRVVRIIARPDCFIVETAPSTAPSTEYASRKARPVL
jgi:hypothetical protein